MNDWGPSAWNFLHHVTFSYPENPTPQEQQDAEQFFSSLRSLLPCEEYKTNFVHELSTFPVDTRSRYALSNWLVNVHNSVNVRLNKKTLTYAEATKLYDTECAQCKNKNGVRALASTPFAKGVVVLTIMSILFVLIILYLYFQNQKRLLRR